MCMRDDQHFLAQKTTSNFLPGFRKKLSNSRPDPKIGVAYKRKCKERVWDVYLLVFWYPVTNFNFSIHYSLDDYTCIQDITPNHQIFVKTETLKDFVRRVRHLSFKKDFLLHSLFKGFCMDQRVQLPSTFLFRKENLRRPQHHRL